jgi:hypothetical protein
LHRRRLGAIGGIEDHPQIYAANGKKIHGAKKIVEGLRDVLDFIFLVFLPKKF